MEDRCVFCGEIVPEGMQCCPACSYEIRFGVRPRRYRDSLGCEVVSYDPADKEHIGEEEEKPVEAEKYEHRFKKRFRDSD